MELEARPRRHRSLTKPWDSRDAYIRHGMTTFAPDSGPMVSCEHRSSSLSGSPPIAILKAGSDLISSQSLPSG